MSVDALKILIVDDNEIYRGFLAEVLRGIDDAEVIGTVNGGRAALKQLKQTMADMVLLDIEMPLMDGIETLEKIRELFPDIGVVMVSAFYSDGMDKVIRALEMGAIDFVSKTEIGDLQEGVLALRRRLKTLMGLFRARRNASFARRLTDPEAAARFGQKPEGFIEAVEAREGSGLAVPPMLVRPSRIELVAIGVSTGGPLALTHILPALPGDLGVPVLLVQHMPPLLTASLADSLDRKSSLRVREAQDGEEILSNTVYVAPGGKHMVVHRTRCETRPTGSRVVRINEDPPVNSCRPSVDVLLRSAAESYDGGILAVIMTGMGNDGTEGVRVLKRRTCYCLTQTEDTCVVYGMPRAVDEAGLSDERVPLERLAQRIHDLVKGRRGNAK